VGPDGWSNDGIQPGSVDDAGTAQRGRGVDGLTEVGYVLAVLTELQNVMESGDAIPQDGMGWLKLSMSVLLAAWGRMQKDASITHSGQVAANHLRDSLGAVAVDPEYWASLPGWDFQGKEVNELAELTIGSLASWE
jgi:hypothetical protein